MRRYRFLNAGITSLANQRNCSLNSPGPIPSAQWIMKLSSPGYFPSIDLMPSITSFGVPQNRLLRHPVLQGWRLCGRARRTPGAAVLIGIPHEAERREPLEALVVGGLEPPHRFFLAAGEIHLGAPDHVLAEFFLLAVLEAGGVVGAHHRLAQPCVRTQPW